MYGMKTFKKNEERTFFKTTCHQRKADVISVSSDTRCRTAYHCLQTDLHRNALWITSIHEMDSSDSTYDADYHHLYGGEGTGTFRIEHVWSETFYEIRKGTAEEPVAEMENDGMEKWNGSYKTIIPANLKRNEAEEQLPTMEQRFVFAAEQATMRLQTMDSSNIGFFVRCAM